MPLTGLEADISWSALWPWFVISKYPAAMSRPGKGGNIRAAPLEM